MSNLEKDPGEVLVADIPAASGDIEVLEPREVPLGGPRAMTVRRTLPQRKRSLIGAWCFVDHYGPDDVLATGGMDVPPHPHTGLQTVSWLFAGEIEHRDSTGAHAIVRPGELNLMTAGRGVQHSERSLPGTRMLHGAQLWIALPNGERGREPGFERFATTPVSVGDGAVQVFLGELGGQRSTATTYTGIVAAQLELPAGGSMTLEVDAAFEHGMLVDAGEAELDGVTVARDRLAFAPAGRGSLHVQATDGPLRALLIGGEPLDERIVMWWNFVGRDHDEIVGFRAEWQGDVIAGAATAGRFGSIPDHPERALPAPELPNVRLRPRD